jgi:gliding motility-associated protein GldM
VNVGSVPKENIRANMTNGRIIERNNNLYVQPESEDLQGRKTAISLYATIGGEERFMGTTNWRVKSVPDPEAQIAGKSGGNITKSRLLVEDGVAAVLEDFDFDFQYTVTQFDLWIQDAEGYTSNFTSTSNRFTQEQIDQFSQLIPGSIILIENIKARGTDNSIRDLNAISFKIQ